jgi:hypothetical protein
MRLIDVMKVAAAALRISCVDLRTLDVSSFCVTSMHTADDSSLSSVRSLFMLIAR